MEQVEFAFCLALLNEISGDLLSISNNLQNRSIDLIDCCRRVADLRVRLGDYKTNDKSFDRVYMASIESKFLCHLEVSFCMQHMRF